MDPHAPSLFANPTVAAATEIPALLGQIRDRAIKLAGVLASPALASFPSDAAAGISDLAKMLGSMAQRIPAPPAVQGQSTSAIGKALDPYTEARVTMQAARERFWRVCDLMDTGKIAEAKTEVQGIIAMLDNITTPDTTTPDTTTTEKSTVTFETEDALRTYAAKESALLAGSTLDPTELAKRARHFEAVTTEIVKALDGLPEFPRAIPIVMSTRYAPDAGGGISVMPGISAAGDQTRKESTMQELASSFSQLGKAASAVAKTAEEAAPPAPVAPAEPAFVWPASLTNTRPQYG